ncbi:hypothetical protein Tco_1108816 [Tanacetum coccineum]
MVSSSSRCGRICYDVKTLIHWFGFMMVDADTTGTGLGSSWYSKSDGAQKRGADDTAVTTGYIIPAGRLYGSYWSAYGFFCLPCSILFVIAASIIGPQTPLDLGRCDAYGLVTYS